MATYLVQVLIGPYSVLDGGAVGDVELTNVALSDDVTRMQPYFNQTAEQIEFFEPLFGDLPAGPLRTGLRRQRVRSGHGAPGSLAVLA